MIRDVFLDMDDTILDFHKSERWALQQALEQMGAPPDEKLLNAYHQINKAQWRLLEQGRLTRDVLKIRRFELLVQQEGLAISPTETAACYEGLLSQGFFYKEGARETLEELRQSYRLYLLSNGSTHIQHRRIAGAGLAPYFEGIYISEEVGADKPSPLFFERCFADIVRRRGTAVDVSAAVMVGDSLTSDILGGNRAGLYTVWLSEGEASAGAEGADVFSGGKKPDAVIHDIRELPELLKKL